MFQTHLKIAWRNLIKDKQFTFLNMFGLAAGLTAALLIFLWVNDELSYDKFFANDDRLYQLMEQMKNGPHEGLSEESSGLLSETVKQQIPGVKYAAPVAPPGWFPQYTLSVNDKNIKANGQYTGKDYFNIFSFKLLDGNSNSVLADRNAIVLSDELATKLFGTTQNLIGKPVRFEKDTTLFVSGVFEKMPVNSSQQFDFVCSFEYYKAEHNWVTYWNNLGPLNYVLLDENTDIKSFNRQVADIVNRNNGQGIRKIIATKFSDNYLHNNYGNNSNATGRIQYVKMFSALALFVLVIACINFMNLSTAKASRRLKEIGIKKVVGAGRKQLITQFLTESMVITVFAGIAAIAFTILLLPAFNQVTGKQIAPELTPKMAGWFIAIILFTSLLAGSYPALYLSKFNPLAVLKGKLTTSVAEHFSRKGLVVFQFSLSSILVICVLVIYQQIQFIQNVDAGYEKENVLRISAEGNIRGKQEAFVADLKKLNGISDASTTNHRMVGHSYGDYSLHWPEQDRENGTFFEAFGVDYDFVETMGIKMVSGRSFSKDYGMDSAAIIVNETAVRTMQLKNPVGMTLEYHGRKVQLVGVVKDFHFESIRDAIKPSLLFLERPGKTIVASVKADNQKKTIAEIEKLYSKYNPGFPFTFNFVDEAYQHQYDSEAKVSVLSKYFASLAIIISCLGLFGLAAFTAQKRGKEISIRKVIGASAASIANMLSVDFLKLIFIALCIALPVSWWLMKEWLQGFVYRIGLTASPFLITAVSMMLLTIVTISYQSVKAALANPIKSLKAE